MVSANDNAPAQPGVADASDDPVTLGRTRTRANVTLTGGAAPYTYTGEDTRDQTPVTYTVVSDDLGESIAVRRGECVIIARLIDDVIEQLRTKVANDQ